MKCLPAQAPPRLQVPIGHYGICFAHLRSIRRKIGSVTKSNHSLRGLNKITNK